MICTERRRVGLCKATDLRLTFHFPRRWVHSYFDRQEGKEREREREEERRQEPQMKGERRPEYAERKEYQRKKKRPDRLLDTAKAPARAPQHVKLASNQLSRNTQGGVLGQV